MFQTVTRFDDYDLELGMRLNSQIRLFAGLLCVIGLVVFGSLRLWVGKSLTPKGESRFAYVDRPTAEDHAQWDREAAESQRVKLGGDYYLPLQRLFEFPGVDHPSMVSKDHIALASETPIVGIEVSGEAYAFVLDSMSDPRTHIVNLMSTEWRFQELIAIWWIVFVCCTPKAKSCYHLVLVDLMLIINWCCCGRESGTGSRPPNFP